MLTRRSLNQNYAERLEPEPEPVTVIDMCLSLPHEAGPRQPP